VSHLEAALDQVARLLHAGSDRAGARAAAGGRAVLRTLVALLELVEESVAAGQRPELVAVHAVVRDEEQLSAPVLERLDATARLAGRDVRRTARAGSRTVGEPELECAVRRLDAEVRDVVDHRDRMDPVVGEPGLEVGYHPSTALGTVGAPQLLAGVGRGCGEQQHVAEPDEAERCRRVRARGDVLDAIRPALRTIAAP